MPASAPRTRLVLTSLLAFLPLAACAGNFPSDFPPGLDPIDAENRAPDPEPGTETLAVVKGRSADYGWVHARGYVKAPLADVYAAMRVPAVCVDRRQTDKWSLVEGYSDPDYEYAFRLRASNSFCIGFCITADWENTWRLGPYPWKSQQDPLAAVAARWKKTWGTTYVSLMEGWVLAKAQPDGTTYIEIMEHLDANELRGSNQDNAEGTARLYYESLVAQVHGQPLPK